jgi:hypothetical protein
MSIFKYLILLAICTVFCWIAWFLVLFMIDPGEAGFLAFLFFYLSFALALIGTFSIVGLMWRWRFSKDEMAYKHVRIASRQSILFALVMVTTLILQSQHLLTWWNLLIVLVVAAGVELFFISYKKFNK